MSHKDRAAFRPSDADQKALGSKGPVITWDAADSIHPIDIDFCDNTKVTNMQAYLLHISTSFSLPLV